ncbi:shematrin-like protein 1 [Musca vetustissima]|uniref:shematrin-like protein 1 n=1 Tax=Musca vetustissima TaxID=27455 RepID=UPI002AB769CB|nr:shematrin-like protein 1 [Musca vetustissima]
MKFTIVLLVLSVAVVAVYCQPIENVQAESLASADADLAVDPDTGAVRKARYYGGYYPYGGYGYGYPSYGGYGGGYYPQYGGYGYPGGIGYSGSSSIAIAGSFSGGGFYG